MALCLVTWSLCLGGVSATVILPADFTTVVTESGVIVHGRVVSVDRISQVRSASIESVVTVAVIESLKGDAGRDGVVPRPNGRSDGIGACSSALPNSAAGDEVIVFLQGRPPAMPSVFGLSQGLYRVTRDAAARAMVMPPRMTAGDGRMVRGDPAASPLPIDAFAREVRAVAGACAVKARRLHRHSSLCVAVLSQDAHAYLHFTTSAAARRAC